MLNYTEKPYIHGILRISGHEIDGMEWIILDPAIVHLLELQTP